VQSRIQFNGDGSVTGWQYKPDVARRELCRLISRLDLPLGFVMKKHLRSTFGVLTILVFLESLDRPLLEIWKNTFLSVVLL